MFKRENLNISVLIFSATVNESLHLNWNALGTASVKPHGLQAFVINTQIEHLMA